MLLAAIAFHFVLLLVAIPFHFCWITRQSNVVFILHLQALHDVFGASAKKTGYACALICYYIPNEG